MTALKFGRGRMGEIMLNKDRNLVLKEFYVTIRASILTLTAATFFATPLIADEKLSIGYYNEWPTPNLYDVNNAELERELGMPVEWVPVDNIFIMAAMMATEDIDLAYSISTDAFAHLLDQGMRVEAIEIPAVYKSKSGNSAEFDVTVVSKTTGQDYPDIIARFLAFNHRASERALSGLDPMIEEIAAKSKMSIEEALLEMSTVSFPTLQYQIDALSENSTAANIELGGSFEEIKSNFNSQFLDSAIAACPSAGNGWINFILCKFGWS